jgi:D-alanine transaminase
VNQVYLNGEFLPPDEAKISVFDRGFIFGDGVYEVIPAYGRRLFRLTPHMDRLDRSLAAIGIANPLSRPQWQAMLERLLAENPGDDQYLYVQITRGVAPRDHAYPDGVRPTVFAYAQALSPPDAELVENGIAVVTAADIRWQRCDIKAIALLANVMSRQQALEQGVTEAILVRNGRVTEGAASNIFAVLDGVLRTPPKGRQILPGITRDLVVELAHQHGIACEETDFSEAELLAAGEVWLTSSTKEILPITRINDQAIGDGHPGELFARMYRIYQDYKSAFRAGEVA